MNIWIYVQTGSVRGRSRELASVWSPNRNAAFCYTSMRHHWKQTHKSLHPPAPQLAAVWIMKSPLPPGCSPGVKRLLSVSQWERTRAPCSWDGCGVLVDPTLGATSRLKLPVTHTLHPPSRLPPAHHSLSLCHPKSGKMKPLKQANLPFHLLQRAQRLLSDYHACRAHTHT